MLQKAVELRPEDGYIVDSLGWAHYRLGDSPRAVQYLEQAIELVPDDPPNKRAIDSAVVTQTIDWIEQLAAAVLVVLDASA